MPRLTGRSEATLKKIDFKKSRKNLYTAPAGRFVNVDVPALQFVKVDGRGDPNREPAYVRAVEWLYSTSYAMKFAARAKLGRDYVVPPLEGLWWVDDPQDFVDGNKSRWQWTLMIMTPDFIDRSFYDAALDKTRGKLADPPGHSGSNLCTKGGACRRWHIGRYDDESPVLAKLHNEVMPSMGLTFSGPHHEIYLSDARIDCSRGG